MEEKLAFEKIHLKYCKTIVGLKRTSCNISAISELGRLPVTSFIKIQVMTYFTRINSLSVNPSISGDALNVNKKMRDIFHGIL